MTDTTRPLVDDPTGALASSSEEESARALAERYRLEYVDVASFAPDPEILKSVPVDLMFRYNFLPYRRPARTVLLRLCGPPPIAPGRAGSAPLHTPRRGGGGSATPAADGTERVSGRT